MPDLTVASAATIAVPAGASIDPLDSRADAPERRGEYACVYVSE